MIETEKDIVLNNEEFIVLIGESLASKSFTADPKLASLREMWEKTLAYDFARERNFVRELQENNTKKFEVLTDIINEEIQITKEQKKALKNMTIPSYITKVSTQNDDMRFEQYESRLEPFNTKTLESASRLISMTETNSPSELEQM